MKNRAVTTALLALYVLISSTAVAQEQITYTNPVIKGFFPDPSTIRVGEDYYTINSTFQYFPALAVSHSKDMVNWQQVSYVFDDKNPIDLTHFFDGCGLWAPDISYHNGQFYVFYCLVQLTKDRSINVRGNYVTHSKSIYGPWSTPVQLTDYGSDPSHFVDDNGDHFMLFAAGIPTGNGTLIVKLDNECKKIVEGPFWMETDGKKSAPEGPHLMKKDGRYYFMMAASSGAFDGHHQLLARSRNVYGPYESFPDNPFVAQYNADALNSHQGHGKMFNTPNGDWFITLLTQRSDSLDASHPKVSQLGRETSLYPVEWRNDGWPQVRLGDRLPDTFSIDRQSNNGLNSDQNTDNFDSEQLDIRWLNVRNPIYNERLLDQRKGWLRLKTSNFTLDQIQARNIVVQRETSKHYTATTKMEFTPLSCEQAGMVCYYDTSSYISFSLRKTSDGFSLVVEEKCGRDKIKRIAGQQTITNNQTLWLRITTDGTRRQFDYSNDNREWTTVATVANSWYLSDEGTAGWGFMGTMVGLYALNCGSGIRCNADFDFFTLLNR